MSAVGWRANRARTNSRSPISKKLRRLATSSLRSNDLFGRIGGEEFACLLPVIGRRDALRLAERVRVAFEGVYHTIGEHRLSATVSVGVAIADDSSLDLDTLLKQADQALGRAKRAGRNCVEQSPAQTKANSRAA